MTADIWAILRADSCDESLVAAFVDLDAAFAFADGIDLLADVRIVKCNPTLTTEQWDRVVPIRGSDAPIRYVNYVAHVTVTRGKS